MSEPRGPAHNLTSDDANVGGTDAVEVHRDLIYATASERELTLDLYLPSDREEPCPIVLYLHGGAFMAGAKDDNAQDRLVPVARTRIGVASASYRFSM